MFAAFLTAPGLTNAFLAGVLTGFLPCGLVYAYVALAASAGALPAGAATMVLFGAGTAPLMILTGSGASLLSLAARRRVLHAAAWCVVLTGVLTISRGALSWQTRADSSTNACPLCTSR
jgi:sulfite exporter TauE/SafE